MSSLPHAEEIQARLSNSNDKAFVFTLLGNLGKLSKSVGIAHVMPRVVMDLEAIGASHCAVPVTHGLHRVNSESRVNTIGETTSEVKGDWPIRKLATHVNNLAHTRVLGEIQQLLGAVGLLHRLVKFARLLGHFLRKGDGGVQVGVVVDGENMARA